MHDHFGSVNSKNLTTSSLKKLSAWLSLQFSYFRITSIFTRSVSKKQNFRTINLCNTETQKSPWQLLTTLGIQGATGAIIFCLHISKHCYAL